MPSTYTSNLRLEKPATGEQAGTWGQTANKDYDFLDTAIDGNVYITLPNAGYFLSTPDGVDSISRNKVIVWIGPLTSDGVTVNITPDSVKKLYFMANATSGGHSITFSQGGGGSFVLAPGASAIIFCDGGGLAAQVSGALYNPQFGSVLVQGQASTSSIKLLAGSATNIIEFRKDLAGTIAASIGLNTPTTSLGNDLIFSTLLPPDGWTERLRIGAAGFIDVRAPLNAYQRVIATSNVDLTAAFDTAAVQIRETNLVGSLQLLDRWAPRIAFYWAGHNAAAQIGLTYNGILRAMNYDGSLGGFQCSTLSVTTVNADTLNASVLNAGTVTLSGNLAAVTVNATNVTVATNFNSPNWNLFTLQTPAQVPAPQTPPIPGQVLVSDAAGNVHFSFINTVSGARTTEAINRVYASDDGWIRYYTLNNFAIQLAPLLPPLLPAPPSTSPFTTQAVVARVFDVNYHNTSGRAMQVVATINLNPAANVTARSDSAAAPTTVVGTAAITGGTTNANQQLVFIVLAGNYYQLKFNAGPASIVSVVEWT